MIFFEITDKSVVDFLTQNISDEQTIRKYFHYEDFEQKLGLNELILIPTLQKKTLVLIIPRVAFELGYSLPFQANRISKLHFYEIVFGVSAYRYFKLIDQDIANQVRERVQNKQTYSDLLSFGPLHYKAKDNSSTSMLINPASLCGINSVYIMLDTANLIEEYKAPNFLVETSHVQFYEELLKTKADQKLKESKYKQKYLFYNDATIPIPKVIANSPEAARGFCGFLKGIGAASYKTTSEGLLFFNN